MNFEEEITKLKARQGSQEKASLHFYSEFIGWKDRIKDLETDIKCLRKERKPLLNKILG